MTQKTFIIDCPSCKAKVAAIESGVAENSGTWEESGEPYADSLHIGKCPRCNSLLAGTSYQRYFAGYDHDYDIWSDIVRVYPNPPKAFSSSKIPKVVLHSLEEAEKSLQVDACTASCVMMGRALEAVCRDLLIDKTESSKTKKKIMLGKGIKELKEKGIIDERLYDWSQELQAFRNIAAHPEDTVISRDDADDLQSFVYAIIEYIYDLTERYEDFKKRTKK